MELYLPAPTAVHYKEHYKEKYKQNPSNMKCFKNTEGKTRRDKIRDQIFRKAVGIQNLLIK
jgi:hypothetical protein